MTMGSNERALPGRPTDALKTLKARVRKTIKVWRKRAHRTTRSLHRALPAPLGTNDRKPRFSFTDRTLTIVSDPGGEAIQLVSAPQEAGEIQHTFDEWHFDPATRRLRVRGWAFVDGAPLFRRATEMVLVGARGAYRFPLRRRIRPDIRKAFGTPWLERSGFYRTIVLPALPVGEYRVALLLSCGEFADDVRTAAADLQSYLVAPKPGGLGLDTLEELDDELREMADAQARSFGEWLGHSTFFPLS